MALDAAPDAPGELALPGGCRHRHPVVVVPEPVDQVL